MADEPTNATGQDGTDQLAPEPAAFADVLQSVQDAKHLSDGERENLNDNIARLRRENKSHREAAAAARAEADRLKQALEDSKASHKAALTKLYLRSEVAGLGHELKAKKPAQVFALMEAEGVLTDVRVDLDAGRVDGLREKMEAWLKDNPHFVEPESGGEPAPGGTEPNAPSGDPTGQPGQSAPAGQQQAPDMQQQGATLPGPQPAPMTAGQSPQGAGSPDQQRPPIFEPRPTVGGALANLGRMTGTGQ